MTLRAPLQSDANNDGHNVNLYTLVEALMGEGEMVGSSRANCLNNNKK